MRERKALMSVAILYHNPQRPDEIGMALVSDPESVAGKLARLRRLGFAIDKISEQPNPLLQSN